MMIDETCRLMITSASPVYVWYVKSPAYTGTCLLYILYIYQRALSAFRLTISLIQIGAKGEVQPFETG